jgi:hypothetical protein
VAVGPRDIQITREEVLGWLQEFDGTISDLRGYLTEKVDAKNLEDDKVDTRDREDVAANEVSVVDLIIADLGSYV